MYARVMRLALMLSLGALLPLAPDADIVRPALAAGPTCMVNSAGGATYTTIQAAINDTGCTTINVAGGTYTGNVTLNRSLALRGASPVTTIIDGGMNGRVIEINQPATVQISNVTIQNGVGGILNTGSVTITNSSISHNYVYGGGGGGIANIGSATLISTTVSNNSSGYGGGGIYNTSDATMSIRSSTIISNSTQDTGGGIHTDGTLNESGTIRVKVTNSTISGNRAVRGAGIAHFGNSILEVTNSTIVANSYGNTVGPGFGAGIGTGFDISSVRLTNTIVANNPGNDCIGPVTSLGHNLSGDDTCGLTSTGDISDTTPLLGPLQYNGGSTQTHALLGGSPAIDGGANIVCSGSDQRGILRPLDGDGNGTIICDIGAYEYDRSGGSGPAITDLNPASGDAGDAAFSLAISGRSFVSGSLVRWNGSNRPTTFISGTQLIGQISAADIGAPGTAIVSVANPGGSSSNSVPFTIKQPRLAITGMSPVSATAGDPELTLTLTGTLFVNGSTMRWNGAPLPTKFDSSTHLTAQVSAARLASGGLVPVRVANPDNSTSNTITFTVNNRIPAIASVSPTLVATGGPTFTLTVSGANFVNGSVVQWNDAARPTTFVSSTHLMAQISAADIALAQQANVTVVNPAPGGGSSNEATIDVGIAYAGSIGGGVPTVAISGTLAYIGEGSEFTILNISNPAVPVRLGGFTTREMVQDVEVVGSKAYITADHDGLLILDVSNLAHPKLLGSYNTPWHAYDVQVVGNIAYVAAEYGGLQIIDVSDPAHPRLLSHYNMTAYDLSVVNNVVYIAAGNSYDPFMSIDVHDPAHPTLRDDYAGDPNFGVTTGVYVVGHLAYMASSDNLIIANVTAPSNGFPGPYYAYDFHDHVKDVYVTGNRAYVTSYAGKLYIMDVTDWQHPQLLSTYETHGSSWDVRVVGSRAYVADGVGGLLILDVSNASAPAKLGKYATWSAYNQTIVANRAYIAGGVTGLQILDVSSPTAPTRLGRFATSGRAADVDVVNNLAFIANRGIWNGSTYVGGGIQIVGIGNPARPALLGSYSLEDAPDVQVVSNRVYVAASDGLYILDVSNPAHPVLAGKYSSSSVPAFSGVQVVGNRAYTIAYIGIDMGIAILDVTNPISPTLLGSYIGLGNATDLQVIGNLAYVTDRYSGLQILDVHDPAHINKLGGYSNDYTSASAVHVVGSLAYVAESEQNAGDLAIVDVSNPAKLKLVGERHLPWHALGVQVVGNLVYIASEQDGLQILRLPISYRVFLPLARR